MIAIFAASSRDARLIPEAVGDEICVVNARQLVLADTGFECLIVGCRSPIPSETLALLREMERARPWVPVVLVTDRQPEVARRLSAVKVSAIVWFADLWTGLRIEIDAARESIPFLHLADELEGSGAALGSSICAGVQSPRRHRPAGAQRG